MWTVVVIAGYRSSPAGRSIPSHVIGIIPQARVYIRGDSLPDCIQSNKQDGQTKK
jgi:hypothetical protein